jgi:hypothetical protein
MRAAFFCTSQIGSAAKLSASSGLYICDLLLMQTGLLIGKVGVSSRNHIYALLPTPPSETTANTKSGTNRAVKGEPSIQVDAEWIGEHTRQVRKLSVSG